jgi:hypothetical protein
MMAPGRFFRKVFVPFTSSDWAFGSCASCTSGQPARVPRLLFRKPRWARRIAWQVASAVPEDRSRDAEMFVLRHRLSILMAFHRRIKKVDVVSAMLELFAAMSAVKPNISHVPETE